MDRSEIFEPESMYTIMAWSFPIWYFWVLLSMNRWILSRSVLLQVFLDLLCCLSIRLISYVLSVAIFCSKIVLFLCHLVVGMSSCILPQLVGRIFFIVLGCLIFCIGFPYFDIFFVFLLFLIFSGLFPWVVLPVLLFPFCPNMFKRFSSVLSFFLAVIDLLSAFLVEFPNQVLTSCLYSWGTPIFSQSYFAPAWISSFNSVMFYVETYVNNSFTFLVSVLNVLES